MLQTEDDRKRIRGIIVNKFRGDLRLFNDGRLMLEDICGVPVLGVIPYFRDIHIDDEDSVALEHRRHGLSATDSRKSVAVVHLPHISNFTDFAMLERDPRVNLFYTSVPGDLDLADIVILPGTKTTLSDLADLRRNGMAGAILRAHSAGKTIVGICGGFQMLGRMISDPEGIEGSPSSLPGLGMLPMETVMTPLKTTRQVEFDFHGVRCQGYEIHQGQSTAMEMIVESGNCIGTYVHGCLDNQVVIDYLLKDYSSSHPAAPDMAELRDKQYDLLADHVRRYLDMPRLYQILTTP